MTRNFFAAEKGNDVIIWIWLINHWNSEQRAALATGCSARKQFDCLSICLYNLANVSEESSQIDECNLKQNTTTTKHENTKKKTKRLH